MGVMFDLNAFAKEVHAVSVAHGWWGESTVHTKLAMIHAKWSEALEAHRTEQPVVWYRCDASNYEGRVHRNFKPEGIAVKLVDGVLRIMDFVEGYFPEDEWDWETKIRMAMPEPDMYKNEPFADMVCMLHMFTGYYTACGPVIPIKRNEGDLIVAAAIALELIKEQGIDPWELLHTKHEYNKTRPYKHGGKKC